MQKILSPANRLIIAADFKPGDTYGIKHGKTEFFYKRDLVRKNVLALADKLHGTGVCLKVNSALRACGYGLIGEIRVRGLQVFADLKLFDISETLSTDGMLLSEARPEILTASLASGVKAMKALKTQLPHTELLGVTVLTSHDEADSRAMFVCSTEEAVMRLARIGAEAEIDGLVASPKEVEALRAKFGILFKLNAPGVRPMYEMVEGDDQNPDRIMTPAKAILAGADRVVIGRPVIRSKNPRETVKRIIEEIALVKP